MQEALSQLQVDYIDLLMVSLDSESEDKSESGASTEDDEEDNPIKAITSCLTVLKVIQEL